MLLFWYFVCYNLMRRKTHGEIMKKLLRIYTILILFVIFIIAYGLIFNGESKTYKLEIISSYGDNEAYHPKVITFDKKWNGYKYWMSYTPYPGGNSGYENPHIVVSNDLVNWYAPNGENKSLDEVKNKYKKKRYNSDAHIVYNKDKDIIICYWRYVDDTNESVTIFKRETKDGVTWTDKEKVLYSKNRHKKDYVSPAIIYDEGIYKMWYVNVCNTITYAESTDGSKWTDKNKISFKYPSKLDTWHLDVIKTDKGYEMITVAYDKWHNHNRMDLYYTYSTDEVNFGDAIKIFEPERGTLNWDNSGIYRSSMIYLDGMYYLYYGAVGVTAERGIGFAYGKDITKLKRDKTNYKDPKKVKRLIEKLER